MKKTYVLLFAFVLIFALLCGGCCNCCDCNKGSDFSNPTPSVPDDVSQNENVSSNKISIESDASYVSKYYFELQYGLDLEYEFERAQCTCNADYANLHSKYARLWRDLGDKYYGLLLRDEFCKDIEAVELIPEFHDRLLTFIEYRIFLDRDIQKAIFQSGSTAGIAIASRDHQAQRHYALEMYRLCKEMMIDCEAP